MSIGTLKKFAIALETTPDELMGFKVEAALDNEIADMYSCLDLDDKEAIIRTIKGMLMFKQQSA